MALGIILQFLGLFDFHMLWKAWEPHLKTESEDCGEPYGSAFIHWMACHGAECGGGTTRTSFIETN